MKLHHVLGPLPLVWAVSSAFAETSNAQTAPETSAAKPAAVEANRAVGATAGLLSGVGFAYRVYAPDESSAHHLGGIAFGEKSELFVNLGYEYVAYLSQFERSRLAWITGVSNFFSKDSYGSWNLASVGAGISFEYGEKKGLNFVFDLPLSIGVTYEEVEGPGPAANSGSMSFRVYPIPAAMMLFRF